MVPGESAAKPAAPTVWPTNALSMLLNSGEAKKIPRAGRANLSMLRLLPRTTFLAGGPIDVVDSFAIGRVSRGTLGTDASKRAADGKVWTVLDANNVR